MPDKKIRLLEEIILITFFIVVLSLPLLGLIFHLDPIPTWENRRLASFPALSASLSDVAHFPGRFCAYFNDHFGFRSTLIRWQAIVKVRWLGVSSSPQVIMGRDGWLFYSGDKLFESYCGTEPFKEEEMARWQRVLEARRNWLKQRGINFLVTIAPEKQTIYPEYMPGDLLRVRSDSRLDQLIKYLMEHSDLEILDLRPALLEAKAKQRIYYRTNTHWNDPGAFIAYQSIVREMSKSLPDMQPLPADDFEMVTEYAPSGDLTGLLGLQGTILEQEFNLRPRQPLHALMDGKTIDRSRADNPVSLVSEISDTRLPRMVMYRDSFASALIPFLAEHFSHATYLWKQQFDPALIEAEHPDIVLDEMAERFLMAEPAEDPAAIGGSTPKVK